MALPDLRLRETTRRADEDGTIAHAQLSFGNGMIMLGSVLEKETEFGRLMKQPDEIGGFETQSAYVVVSDADEIYRRARENCGRRDRNRNQR
jgi:uncharacterized glyoxalase superfamily protein PhnB